MYELIAHRGICDKDVKQNSLASIKRALLNDKYVGVEFDVRETLDNEIILYHDAFYNNKLISNTYYKELPKYVPKLETILKIKSDKIFLIELKNIKNNYNKFINILNKHKNKNIYVMSFSNKVIEKVNIEDRKYKIGILNYVLNTNKSTLNLEFICILNSLIKNDIVNKLKDLEIFSYGLFDKKSLKNIYYIVDAV